MNLLKKYLPSVAFWMQIVLIIVWLSNLAATDAYFSVYCIIAFTAFVSCMHNRQADCFISKRYVSAINIASIILSALVIAANYRIFTLQRDPVFIQASTNLLVNMINTFLSLVGGIFVFHPILVWMYRSFPVKCKTNLRQFGDKRHRLFVCVSFAVIAGIYLIHLLLVEYPGNITEDPFAQIAEMVSGRYSDFNSFWHTMFLQGILSIGYFLFDDVNAAVAVLCSVQALILAGTFCYCLSTLYLAGLPAWFLAVSFVIYGCLPYNIALSVTIWKDVLFAAGCLLFSASLFRIIRNLGRSIWNYVLLIFGGILFCLSRSNGWFVFLLSLLICLAPLWKNKKLLCSITAVFMICWTLCNPVLKLLNVAGGDFTESLSVPLQQVARVITDGCELTEEETDLIGRVLDIEEVPQLYTNWLSDPIKVEFRSNDVTYFNENRGEYLKLWIRLGMRYPAEYFKAWVDQTKGYWNGGYSYAMYSETVTDNPYGVEKTGGGNLVAALFGIYFGLSRHVIFFEPFHSIGLHVWIASAFTLLSVLKKRKEWVLAVPSLVVILIMCVGTPVYSCFRYAYPLFAVFPLIVGTGMYDTNA